MECLRTIGMGGIGKHRTKLPPLLLEEETNRLGHLHVPIPTALRPSLPLPSSLPNPTATNFHMLHIKEIAG